MSYKDVYAEPDVAGPNSSTISPSPAGGARSLFGLPRPRSQPQSEGDDQCGECRTSSTSFSGLKSVAAGYLEGSRSSGITSVVIVDFTPTVAPNAKTLAACSTSNPKEDFRHNSESADGPRIRS